MADLAHPLVPNIDITKMVEDIKPKTLADKAKDSAIKMALAGVIMLAKFGYQKGTFRPTKYTIPIYAVFGGGVVYFAWKYKKEAQTLAMKLQEGFSTQA
jgi:hypothetical protein